MIDIALDFVRGVLDQYLMHAFDLDGSVVVLNGMVDSNGNVSQKNQNRIVISLVHLDWETNKQFFGGQRREMDMVHQINPPVVFNLDILLSSHFDDYREALKFLTAAITFFQANQSLTRTNYPAMPDGINALKFEIENSSYGKSFELWSALGAKYQPSIIYKIRQVAIQAGEIKRISSLAGGGSSA